MNSAISLAIGALIVGLVSLFGTLIYVMTAAERVNYETEPYSDHDSMIDHE